MAKSILTTSLAAIRKSSKAEMRRRVIAHGSTDADDIEVKRQNCSKQLIKMNEVVSKLHRQRILMETSGEKKIEEMRQNFAEQRKKAVEAGMDADKLARHDAIANAKIEEEAFSLSMLLTDYELKTAQLSCQIATIDTLNLIVDCLSCREEEEESGGGKVKTRYSVAAYLSDILNRVDDMETALENVANSENQPEEEESKPKSIPLKPNGVKP